MGAKTAWTLVISVSVIAGVVIALAIAQRVWQGEAAVEQSGVSTPNATSPPRAQPSVAQETASPSTPAAPEAIPSAGAPLPSPGPAPDSAPEPAPGTQPVDTLPAPPREEVPALQEEDKAEEYVLPEPEPDPTCAPGEGVVISVTGAERSDFSVGNPFALFQLTLTVENRVRGPVSVGPATLYFQSVFREGSPQWGSFAFEGIQLPAGESADVRMDEPDVMQEYSGNEKARAITISGESLLYADYMDYEEPLYCEYPVLIGDAYRLR